MTATTDRKVATGPTQQVRAGQYAAPRVNLLPPEVYGAQAMGRLKRTLALSLVGVLLVSAGGYAAFSFALSAQKSALADAESETIRLTQAQADYSEVPTVLNRLGQLQAARELGMSTETMWADYLGYVFAVLPGGTQLASMKVEGATPMLSPAVPTDSLAPESVSRLDLTAVSDTIPNVADWQDRLATIPGFADPRVTVATAGADPDTQAPRYEIAVSVLVTDEAYANRYLPTTEEG